MKQILAVFFLILVFALSASAKEGSIVHTYMTKQGLPSNAVSCVIQDRDGFIWFGTDNGVSRFDGRRNLVFRTSNQHIYHIGDNQVFALMEDGEGNIWAGTKNGVSVCRDGLNFETFEYKTRYGVSPSCEVTSIVQTLSGDILFGTLGQGLFVFNPESGVLRQDNIHVTFISDICSIDNAVYLATMREGIAHYSVSGSFVDYVKNEDGSRFLDNIHCFAVSDDVVWMGSRGCRIYSMDSRGRIARFIDARNSGFKTIIGMYTETGYPELLIGTDRGLFHIPKESSSHDRLYQEKDPVFFDAEVEGACRDKEGGLWMATSNLGVIYLSHRQKPFKTITNEKLRMVNDFCEDTNTGRIWLAGRNGLFYKDKGSEQFNQYILNAEGYQDEIKALCIADRELWIGTYGQGLRVMDLQTGEIRSYKRDTNKPNSLCDNYVISICNRKNGDICVGTRWGFCYFRPDLGDFHTFTSLGFTINVTDIKEDASGNLWISTSNSGIYVMYSGAYDFVHYEGDTPDDHSFPPSTDVICIYPGKDGKTWFGTNAKGLYYFDGNTREFSVFRPGDTWLTSRTVFSMEHDYNGFFCLATDAGFVHIPETESMNYQIMTSEDGLVGDQFNNGASLSSRDGLIYFGETRGVDVLDFASFDNNKYVPVTFISDIRLNNAGSEEESFKKLNISARPYKVSEITLPYYDNNISFTFSALSYQDPPKNRFSYMMEGADVNWVTDVETNGAVYNNLRPGKYLLRVKASNNDNVWNERETQLHLTITPPWWQSNLAWSVYSLFVICSAFAGVQLYRRRSKEKYMKLLESLNENKEKEIYRSKIEFFTQIVHEIRTPLTLIKLPVDSLKNRLGAADKDCQTIDRNMNYLLSVVNELLDMQKIENGDIQLQTVRIDFLGLVKNCCDNFEDAFYSKGIKLFVQLPEHPVEVVVDSVKVSKIIVNLLSNALKFAKSEVDVRLSLNKDNIMFLIDDDGPGIRKENRDKIFKPFFQENNEKSSLGTGIGLTFAQRIARCHKGDLKILDGKLGGAAFELSLPRAVSLEPLASLNKANQLPDIAETSPLKKDKYKILLVEDNKELLDAIAIQLGKWYTVLMADNGKTALRILETSGVDAIVSDVMMPVMDGIEFCQTVKGDINYSHIPVVLLTAKIQLQDKLEGMEAGADVYMEKPFSVEQLHKQIENLFRLRISFHQWIQKLLDAPAISSGELAVYDDFVTESGSKFIFKMNEVINQHLSREDFSLDFFSKELGMSKSSFYRKLHDLSDMTPNEYLKNYRLGCASEMLLKGMRVSEVYPEVGFSTLSYFTKCFKQKYGVLPKDYQKNHSNNKA